MTTNNHTAIAVGAAADAATFNSPLGQLDAAILKNNYTATAAPGVNDDSTQNYSAGSRWVDTTNDQAYVCVDASAGAARWARIDNAVWALPAPAFGITSGSPSQGNLGDPSPGDEFVTWLFDDSLNEVVGTGFKYTGNRAGSTIALDIEWAMESATSGSVVLSVGAAAIAGEELATQTSVINVAGYGVPGAAKTVRITTVSLAVSYVHNDLIRVRVTRAGANGSDTATGDMHLIAVTVRFL